MRSFKSLSFFLSLLAIITTLALLLPWSEAARFDVRNNCRFTVWAAASPGGGRRLDPGQTWSFDVAPGTSGGRVWGRTGCNSGGTGCQTGDCGRLECQGYGQSPSTLVEFALNQFQNLDFIDISLVDGFNLPLDFSGCRSIRCTADINGQCPGPLRVPGGCRNPAPWDNRGFFKQRCPDAYSFPEDDPSSTFTCPGGTNYRVTFCP